MPSLSKNPQFVAYLALSLDGYIAREDGSLDWLPTPEGNDDFGFAEFLGSVDAMIMGHQTYKTVLGFGDLWPYGDLPIWVASHEPEKVQILRNTVATLPADNSQWLPFLQHHGYAKVYVDGGQIIRYFLDQNLLQELTITTIPVILGQGIPLFASHQESQWIAQGERIDQQFVQIKYQRMLS